MPVSKRFLADAQLYAPPDIYEESSQENLLRDISSAGNLGALHQISFLSLYAFEMFDNLSRLAEDVGTRILTSTERTSRLVDNLIVLEGRIAKKSTNSPDEAQIAKKKKQAQKLLKVRSAQHIPSALSKQTNSAQLNGLYSQCNLPPQFWKLETLIFDDCLIRYSNPGFFFEEWLKVELLKQEENRKERKRLKKERKLAKRKRREEEALAAEEGKLDPDQVRRKGLKEQKRKRKEKKNKLKEEVASFVNSANNNISQTPVSQSAVVKNSSTSNLFPTATNYGFKSQPISPVANKKTPVGFINKPTKLPPTKPPPTKPPPTKPPPTKPPPTKPPPTKPLSSKPPPSKRPPNKPPPSKRPPNKPPPSHKPPPNKPPPSRTKNVAPQQKITQQKGPTAGSSAIQSGSNVPKKPIRRSISDDLPPPDDNSSDGPPPDDDPSDDLPPPEDDTIDDFPPPEDDSEVIPTSKVTADEIFDVNEPPPEDDDDEPPPDDEVPLHDEKEDVLDDPPLDDDIPPEENDDLKFDELEDPALKQSEVEDDDVVDEDEDEIMDLPPPMPVFTQPTVQPTKRRMSLLTMTKDKKKMAEEVQANLQRLSLSVPEGDDNDINKVIEDIGQTDVNEGPENETQSLRPVPRQQNVSSQDYLPPSSRRRSSVAPVNFDYVHSENEVQQSSVSGSAESSRRKSLLNPGLNIGLDFQVPTDQNDMTENVDIEHEYDENVQLWEGEEEYQNDESVYDQDGSQYNEYENHDDYYQDGYFWDGTEWVVAGNDVQTDAVHEEVIDEYQQPTFERQQSSLAAFGGDDMLASIRMGNSLRKVAPPEPKIDTRNDMLSMIKKGGVKLKKADAQTQLAKKPDSSDQSDAIARLLSNRAQIAGSDSDSDSDTDSDSDDSYF